MNEEWCDFGVCITQNQEKTEEELRVSPSHRETLYKLASHLEDVSHIKFASHLCYAIRHAYASQSSYENLRTTASQLIHGYLINLASLYNLVTHVIHVSQPIYVTPNPIASHSGNENHTIIASRATDIAKPIIYLRAE